MTRRLALQPPPASTATALRAIPDRPQTVRTPPHSCGTASVPEATARGPATACRARRAILCSARARSAPRWSGGSGPAQSAGGARAQSWQGRNGIGWGNTDGSSGDRASAAQGSADMSRRWEGEEAQRDNWEEFQHEEWSSPAVAVAPDSGLIEVRLCVCFGTKCLRCTTSGPVWKMRLLRVRTIGLWLHMRHRSSRLPLRRGLRTQRRRYHRTSAAARAA